MTLRHLRALRSRLSQRGATLLLIGALDLIYAQGLAWVPVETAATPTYSFLAALLPLPVWAVVWALVGSLCLAQAWTVADRAAYVSAAGLKALWALLNLGAWAAGILPRGYVSAALWLIAAAFVMIVASVPKARR